MCPYFYYFLELIITFFQNYIKRKYNLDTKNDSEYYDQNLVKLEIYFKNHGVTYVKEHSAYTVYYCFSNCLSSIVFVYFLTFEGIFEQEPF